MILPISFGLHLEGAVKEVTWWTWIWQTLVNMFWVLMALNNLFVGYNILLSFLRVSTIHFRYFIKCTEAKHNHLCVQAGLLLLLIFKPQALIVFLQDTN